MKRIALVAIVLAACLGIGVFVLRTANEDKQPVTQNTLSCDDPLIKGNISVSTGEKIYHEPGDLFYDKTRIDESEGEQWFCTADEALDAGWRHSER